MMEARTQSSDSFQQKRFDGGGNGFGPQKSCCLVPTMTCVDFPRQPSNWYKGLAGHFAQRRAAPSYDPQDGGAAPRAVGRPAWR